MTWHYLYFIITPKLLFYVTLHPKLLFIIICPLDPSILMSATLVFSCYRWVWNPKQTAGDKSKESEDDVESSCSSCPEWHTVIMAGLFHLGPCGQWASPTLILVGRTDSGHIKATVGPTHTMGQFFVGQVGLWTCPPHLSLSISYDG